MTMRYSESNQTFYADDVSEAFLPEDAREIDEAERQAILRASIPPESWEQAKARALTALKIERAPIMDVLDGLQATASSKGLDALIAGDTAAAAGHCATAKNIETLKQALKDAPTTVDLTPCPAFEDMRLAFKAYYAQLVASASAEIVLAFKQAA
jgi:hypothetical protein